MRRRCHKSTGGRAFHRCRRRKKGIKKESALRCGRDAQRSNFIEQCGRGHSQILGRYADSTEKLGECLAQSGAPIAKVLKLTSRIFPLEQKLKKSTRVTVLLSKPERRLDPLKSVRYGSYRGPAFLLGSLKLTTLVKSKIIPLQSVSTQGSLSERETRRRWTTKTATWMM